MHKYVIIYLLQPIEDRATFLRDNWPLHITLGQNFAIHESDIPKLQKELALISTLFTPIATKGDAEALFGPDNNIPVITVTKKPALTELHNQIVAAIDHYRPTYDYPQFMREKFQPHVTSRSDSIIKTDQTIHIDSFTLADCDVEDGAYAKLIQTFRLNSV